MGSNVGEYVLWERVGRERPKGRAKASNVRKTNASSLRFFRVRPWDEEDRILLNARIRYPCINNNSVKCKWKCHLREPL